MLQIALVYGHSGGECLPGGPPEYPCKILNFSTGITSGSENTSDDARDLELAVASLVALSTPALAHHAVQSEFDVSGKQQTWKGTLKEVRWVNPHTHFLLDVDEGNGKVTTWVFETAAPNGLRRAGFSQKGVFKVGEQYSFVGYQARDGSKLAFLESLTGPDGKTVKIWFGDPNAN
jgi:hypothetical protein